MGHRVYDKSVIDKLGVKPDSRVAVLGVKDGSFLRQLRERAPDASNRLRQNLDLIFFAADSQTELGKLARLKMILTTKTPRH
ncbi:MAG TPA: hypothetical protein VFL17_17130 [Anaerolineae bacterium]|nr:hypothetical protein [Anaerolineae bacterium]